MSINLRNAAAKKRELAVQLRLSLSLERTLRNRLRKELRRAASMASARYITSGKVDIDPAHVANLAKILHAHYTVTAKAFGLRTRGVIKCNHGPAEMKGTEQEFLLDVAKFAETMTATRIKQITNTTRDQIISVVNRGVAEGLGVAETAKLIRETTGGTIAASRAETIARTETHMASQSGSMLAAESLDVPMKKEWISAEDDRTRPSHSEANGQTAKMGEDFVVGGSRLDFPGDPNGDPSEVINCRCVVTFVVDDSEIDRLLAE